MINNIQYTTSYRNVIDINELVGKVFTRIEKLGNEALQFFTKDTQYLMFHLQDCCEDVYLEDVVGNFADLLNTPILQAYETSNGGEQEYGTFTWTFYTFVTFNGCVTLRWYGESNGYYSEEVTIVHLPLSFEPNNV